MTSVVEISRDEFGVTQKFEFINVENSLLIDEKYDEITFGSLYANCKCIVVFIRHFLCYAAKDYVEDLAKIEQQSLSAADVKLIIIGCGRPKFIRPFREATGYQGYLFVDPSLELYKKMGCLEDYDSTARQGGITASIHVKTNMLVGLISSTFRGMKYAQFQGDMSQQGGQFILGPGPVCTFAHYDRLPVDVASINDLLQTAGLPCVNFQKDSRVFHI